MSEPSEPTVTEAEIAALGAKAAEENREALFCLECYIEQVKQENFGGLGIYGTFARDDVPHLERAAQIIRIALGDTLPPQGD